MHNAIKTEILKIDDELLPRMFEFAAHAINDSKVVRNAFKEFEIEQPEGLAFFKIITELGITNSNDVTTLVEYHELTTFIKTSM